MQSRKHSAVKRDRLTPAQRSQRASIASGHSWARTLDPAKRTAPAREAMLAKFEREAREQYPDADEATITRLAAAARRTYFKELAYRSSIARSQRAAGA